jgi:hypothetical protein
MLQKVRLMKAGELSPAGRIYPLEVLRNAVIKADLDKPMCAYLRAQDFRENPDLSELCGQVKKLYLEDGWLMAEIQFVRNANGLIGASMAEKGCRFVPCGVASISQNVVQNDYEITHVMPTIDECRNYTIKSVARRKARISRGVQEPLC